MAVFVPIESRTDSEEELVARLDTGSHFVSYTPAFRRPLAVGIGLVTVFACTTVALLAAGSGSKQVSTETTAIQDLDELLEAVQDDLSGGGLLGNRLEEFLSDDEGSDTSSLLDEDAEEDPVDEALEDAFSRRLQQEQGMPVAGVPQAGNAAQNPWAEQKKLLGMPVAGMPKSGQAAEVPWAEQKKQLGMPLAGVPKTGQAAENPWAEQKKQLGMPLAGVPKAGNASENPWAEQKKQLGMPLAGVLKAGNAAESPWAEQKKQLGMPVAGVPKAGNASENPWAEQKKQLGMPLAGVPKAGNAAGNPWAEQKKQLGMPAGVPKAGQAAENPWAEQKKQLGMPLAGVPTAGNAAGNPWAEQKKQGMPVAGVPKAGQAADSYQRGFLEAPERLLEAPEQKWGMPVAGVPKVGPAAKKPWAAKKQRQARLHAAMHSAFKEADKDHSGFLEVHELAGAASLAHQKLGMPVTKQELAAEVDAIWNDGKLGPKEFCHVLHHLMLFKKLDHDGNGMIQGLELDVLQGLLKKRFGVTPEQFHQLSTAAGASPAGKIAPPVLVRVLAEAEGARVPPWIARLFQKLDTDANGKIDGEELESLKTAIQRKFSLPAQGCEQLVDSVDSNKDRRLTPVELKQMVWRGFSLAKELNPALKQLPPGLGLFFLKSDLNGDGLIAGPKESGVLSGTVMKKFQIRHPRYHELVQEVDHNENGLGPLEFQHLVQKARHEKKGMKPVEKSVDAAVEVARPGAQKNLRAPSAWQPVSKQAF